MYEIMAREIGFTGEFAFDPDIRIKINREPQTQQEWEYVSRFVDETFPLTSDEISHGYSRTSCMIFLPNIEPDLSVTQAAARAGVGRRYINDEIERGNLPATLVGKQYVIHTKDFREWMDKPRRGSRRKAT